MPSSMKCFKIFFKHTWHPQQMDNPARFEPSKTGVAGYNAGETELGEVKIIVPASGISTNATTIEGPSRVVACGSGGCKSSRSRDKPRPESPWHTLKTIFLVSVIVALIVWVIVYTLLAQYEIL